MFDFNLEFARGGANFTTDLINILAAGGVAQNIIFSPFSIQTCIALAFAGAQGETADEIVKTLHFASNVHPEVAQTFQFVLDKYKDSELLKIANKIYVKKGKQLKANYEMDTKKHYHSEAECIDFGENVVAAKAINEWVAERTGGKITDLISSDSLDDDTRLLLLNAIHFKGDWTQQFDKERTAEDDFWIKTNNAIKVQYMHKKAKFNHGYFEELGCSALEMPYKDSDLSMLVLLPFERDGLKSLAEKLKNVNLIELSDKMYEEEVQVKFPKFKIDYTLDLGGILKTLGVKKMFTDGAEFSNMLESPENIYVSKIIHKATIEVNEEGTEAAAATGIVMMTRMLLLPLQFEADRPFLYLIWNKKNILFAGAFVNAPIS